MSAFTSVFEGLELEPKDVLKGLATAERSLLAACLALFDDSSMLKRITELSEKTYHYFEKKFSDEVIELEEKVNQWEESRLSDDALRMLLWMYLRKAFNLPAKVSVSHKGINLLMEDVTAAMLAELAPVGSFKKTAKKLKYQASNLYNRWREKEEVAYDDNEEKFTLNHVVLPVLEEIIAEAEKDEELKEKLEQEALSAAQEKIKQLPPKEQQRIFKKLGVTNVNDIALGSILAAGGSLGTITLSVKSMGFSAYILAAKASAFVPFVSGKGMVSFLAVMANPLTFFVGTAGVMWWASSSASSKIRVLIAARVIALLAIQGIAQPDHTEDKLLAAFATLSNELKKSTLPVKLWVNNNLAAYQKEWNNLAHIRNNYNTGAWYKKFNVSLASLIKGKNFNNPALTEKKKEELQDTLAIAGITLGDFLYHKAAVTPEVIEAADFLYNDGVSGAIDFSLLADQILTGSSRQVLGGISQLKGYVAEQFVAERLMSEGHTVSFPELSNEPGWDILVDGVKYQVKFHAELGGIREHFSKYDYPVIANTELMGRVPEEWADQVFFIDGLSTELVTDITEEALEMGVSLSNNYVPMTALLVSTMRSTLKYSKGQISMAQGVEQIMLDGTVRAGLAFGGGAAGVALGGLLIGPAGALIFGYIAPVTSQLAAGRVKGFLGNSLANREWLVSANNAINTLIDKTNSLLEEKRQQLNKQSFRYRGSSHVRQYLFQRTIDEIYFLEESRCALENIKAAEKDLTPEQRAAQLDLWVAHSNSHLMMAGAQREISAVNNILKNKQTLITDGIDASKDAATRFWKRWNSSEF